MLAPQGTPPAFPESRSGSHFALAVLFAINVLNFYDRQILNAVVEPIRKEWSLTDSQIGWLVTSFILLYAVVGVPLGRLADRFHRPRILSLGLATWSLLTAASGFAWNYTSMFFARLGVGVGEASCAPAANSLIGDLFPPERRARVLSLFILGTPVGGFLGYFVTGKLAAAYGWRMAFYIACIPGLLVAVLALLLLDPPRGASESSHARHRPQDGSPYVVIFKIPTIAWIILTGACFNFMMYGGSVFLPPFLSRFHGLGLSPAATLTAVIFGAAGMPGTVLGGWLADRAAKIWKNGRLLVPMVASFCGAIFFFLALNVPAGRVITFAALMSSGFFFVNWYYAGVYASIQDVVAPGLRATAMSLYFFAMYMLGGSLGPVLTGKLSDYFSRRAMLQSGATQLNDSFRALGLHSALYVVPLVTVLLAIALFLASRTVTRDRAALQRWMSLQHSPQHSQLIPPAGPSQDL